MTNVIYTTRFVVFMIVGDCTHHLLGNFAWILGAPRTFLMVKPRSCGHECCQVLGHPQPPQDVSGGEKHVTLQFWKLIPNVSLEKCPVKHARGNSYL